MMKNKGFNFWLDCTQQKCKMIWLRFFGHVKKKLTLIYYHYTANYIFCCTLLMVMMFYLQGVSRIYGKF